MLLDTDVVIDVLRQHPSAVRWASTERAQEVALPGLAVMQLLDGANTKLEARQVEQFVTQFRVFWPTVADHERARAMFSDLKLAHGIDIIDMLIAQTAAGLGAKLATFNTKHFRAVTNLETIQPYERQM